MLIGYARVSTDDQNLDLQRNALRQAKALEVARAGGVEVQSAWARAPDECDPARGCLRFATVSTSFRVNTARQT